MGCQTIGKQKSDITILDIFYDYRGKRLRKKGRKGNRVRTMSRQRKRGITKPKIRNRNKRANKPQGEIPTMLPKRRVNVKVIVINTLKNHSNQIKFYKY